MRRLPAGLRRLAAVALLALLILGAGLLASLPVRWIAAQDRDLARVETRIAELRGRIAEREQLLAERRLLEAALSDESLFVRALTPALAAAELQGHVGAAVRRHGGEVRTVQVLEPTEAPPFVEVGLRLTLVAELESLVGLLHAIETSRPLLLVRSLQLRVPGDHPAAETPPLETVVELVAFNLRL